jgi:hypothetical protein
VKAFAGSKGEQRLAHKLVAQAFQLSHVEDWAERPRKERSEFAPKSPGVPAAPRHSGNGKRASAPQSTGPLALGTNTTLSSETPRHPAPSGSLKCFRGREAVVGDEAEAKHLVIGLSRENVQSLLRGFGRCNPL